MYDVVLACDHAALDLKNNLKAYLKEKGLNILEIANLISGPHNDY